jgi:hypothetical protein
MTGGSIKKSPANPKVKTATKLEEVPYSFLRILAKGWATPLGSPKPQWCYQVEWAEDASTATKAGATTWEPIQEFQQTQSVMVELFEARLMEAGQKGPPTWNDVAVSF